MPSSEREDGREVISVRVKPEIHRLVKIAAAEKGLTVGEIYENGALRELRGMGKA